MSSRPDEWLLGRCGHTAVGDSSQASFGMPTTLLGLLAAAHFNSVRTWGVFNQAFRHQVDFANFKLLLERCGALWGVRGSAALYGATNMSGSGLPPHGETYLARFPFWFKEVWHNSTFARACGCEKIVCKIGWNGIPSHTASFLQQRLLNGRPRKRLA